MSCRQSGNGSPLDRDGSGYEDALIRLPFRSRNRSTRNKVERDPQKYHYLEKVSLRNKFQTTPKYKSKRKSIFKSIPGKCWNRQDAEKALRVELQARRKQGHTLILRFPDPEISVDMIKGLHSKIEKVHIQVPLRPRYCFIKVSEDSNLEEVIKEVENSDFNSSGRIKVERKCEKPEEDVTPEMIDPYTLYVGNLPLMVTADEIKEKFISASRVDIGFSCRMSFTRYAFLRYQTVEESIDAFESSHDAIIRDRSVIVRFRRIQNGVTTSDPAALPQRRKRREFLKYNGQNTKKMESKLNLDNILEGFNFCENDDQISEEDMKADEEEDDDDDEDDEDDD